MEEQGGQNTISLTPGTPTPAVIEKEAGSVARKSPLSASDHQRPWESVEPGMNRLRVWNFNAESACERHLEAMRREFLKLAGKHGITVNDATILLMNGVQP